MKIANRWLRCVACGFAALFGPGVSAAVEPPLPGPAVVELFTSEGCSSCPPAEAVLGSLAGRADLLVLAFHVTYWDSAAWRDPFGLNAAVDRQARTVRRLRLPSAYTPEAVVNGRADVLGSDGARLLQVSSWLPKPAGVVGLRSPGGVVWRLPDLATHCPCRLQLVSVRAAADTRVNGGENAGRTLREVRIVRSLKGLGDWDGTASDRTVPVADVPEDATSLVLLAENQRDGSIVMAGEIPL